MQRPMRRAAQMLPEAETAKILKTATSGVLALTGPYAVPMSFVWADGKIYFHSAAEGHKIDAVKSDPRASFCIIAEDGVIPEKYTTAYKSVIAFGKMRFAEGEEKHLALRLLGQKYHPSGADEMLEGEISGALSRVAVLVLDVESVAGKEAIELTKKRKEKT